MNRADQPSGAPGGASPATLPPEPAGWSDVDIPGAAKLLGCSKYWVRDRVTAREIPCYRLGTRKGVRFTWPHICEIRAMHEQRPAHETPAAALDAIDRGRLAKSLSTLNRARTSAA